ncbi:MAG: LemA family protein, partial [Patescibacteria group bacterium]
MTAVWIIVILIVLVGGWLVGAYNGLIKLKQRVGDAWSDIDVQLKRRSDLIPNLLETVKGFAGQEKNIFLGV